MIGRGQRPRFEPGEPTGGAVTIRSKRAFQRYVRRPAPLIVRFWAPRSPGREMGPIFDHVARQFAGKIHFLKVNTEQIPELSLAFGVRSLPTLLVIHGKEVTNSRLGATSEETLVEMARRALARHRESLPLRVGRWVRVRRPTTDPGFS